jgi:hypothetical protein
MRYERFVNNEAKTLASDINNVVTTVTLSDTTGYPSEGDFRLLIGSEVMLVTGVSGSDLTVQRGVEGTVAASHTSGDAVNVILTKGGMEAYFDHIMAGATARLPCRLLDSTGAIITASDFTFDNLGLAYLEDNADGSITLGSTETSTTGNAMHVAYKTAPSPPYKVTTLLHTMNVSWSGTGSSSVWGMCFRESATGEFVQLGAISSPPISFQIFSAFRWNSPTSTSAAVPGRLLPDCNVNWAFMQLEDDGVDLHFRASYNGITWFTIASDGRTAFMAGGPDQIAITLSERANGAASNNNPRHEMTCKMWI